MNDAHEIVLVDLKARQLAGEQMLCPRCGRDAMDDVLLHNALSRHADLYICSACGMDEALLDMKRSSKPLTEWACMKTVSLDDFKALPSTEAVSRIMTEQAQFLTMLYERWLKDARLGDFKNYIDAAKQSCPGLTELKNNPFHAVYQTADGAIHVRFTSEGEQTKLEAVIVS